MVIGSNRTMEPKKKFPERLRGGQIGSGWFEMEPCTLDDFKLQFPNVKGDQNAISEREGGKDKIRDFS